MTEWKTIGYLREGETNNYEYQLTLPTPLADWDVFDYWEKPRVHSMEQYLKHTDILFDVGAEMGWLSAVYAKLCKNIFLIEPTKEFWPNIRQIAERNEVSPIGFYAGLLGFDKQGDLPTREEITNWPKESEGQLIDKNKYQYLHEHEQGVPQLALDDLVIVSGIKPTAITIDVEGAELLVLQGAQAALELLRPKVWVSIHPDLMRSNYNTETPELFEFMDRLHYDRELLGIDHEEHWLFLPD